MSKAAFKHPTVFVGCPYEPASVYGRFKELLDSVPLEFVFADSTIKTQQVLDRIRSGMTRSDYCLFDITEWNPNVTLEVGLAEGLNWPYYIIFKPGRGRKRIPPSDLHGKQRMNYKTLWGHTQECLEFQLNNYLVKQLTHPRYVFDNLTGVDKIKKFTVAMRILAHFKNSKAISFDEIRNISQGTYLHDNDFKTIIEILKRRRLISGKLSGHTWRLAKNLYKKVVF